MRCPVVVGEVLPLVVRLNARYDVGTEVIVTRVRRYRDCEMGWMMFAEPIREWLTVAYVVADEAQQPVTDNGA